MPDHLDTLAETAQNTINSGYYKRVETIQRQTMSLQQAISSCSQIPIIAEVKAASPSKGILRRNIDVKEIVDGMMKGGAVGLSILTEPTHFKGRLEFIPEIREEVEVPILMKDFFLDPEQIYVARKIGADVVLLIQALFDRSYTSKSLPKMIDIAHNEGLEVLLEVHTEKEYLSALKTKADMIGINNRDLRTLQVDLAVSKRILSRYPPNQHTIVSESGIQNPQDIHNLKGYGVDAFLIGTALMEADNVETQVNRLVGAF